MDESMVWTAWPIEGPWHLSPLIGGTNNLIWHAEATNGQCYVLRIIPDTTQVPRLRYEAALLQALDSQALPFLLPLPLKTKSGDITITFTQKDGTMALATLCPLLPGRLTDRDALAISNTTHAGATLATLDRALANLPELPAIDNFQPLPTFGDLAHWHPLVPDPLAAVERLPISDLQARQIRHYLSQMIESVPALYHLPHQLLHRDYDRGNILVDEEQHITAVLDFEFAGRDIRILKLCVSISWWPHNLFGTGQEWDAIDALGMAYNNKLPLSEEELLALPAVWRMRDATSLVHRMGRYFASQVTNTHMQDRIKHSLWREEWLAANHATLLEHALRWI